MLNKYLIRVFRQDWLWVLVIILLGLGVRLYCFNSPLADWHSWRQADTASVSRIFLDQGIKIFKPQYYDISSVQTGINNPRGWRMVELPLFNLIHVGLVKVLPSIGFDPAGRLVSILSSLLSAVFIYILGKRFISRAGGLMAAFFFAFLPYNIFFSRVILPEPLATALALLSLVWMVGFIDREKDIYLYLSGLAMALAVLIKPFAAFYLLAAGGLIIEKYHLRGLTNSKLLLKLLIWLNLISLPFYLWRIKISSFPEGIPFFEWMFNGDHIRFRPAFWRWILAERLGKLILGIWGLPLFAVGAFWSKKNSLFIHTFLLGIILYVMTVATANVRHDYYQIFAIPVVSLVLAKGTATVLLDKSDRLLSSLGVVLCVGMMFFIGFYQVKEFYKINHPEIITAGQAVQKLTPKDSLVIAPYNGDTAFLYQTQRFGWPVIDDDLSNLITRGADYYVSVSLGDKDTQMVESKYVVLEKTDAYLIADLHQTK